MLGPAAFAYDASAPLDLIVLGEHAHAGALQQDITYASPAGGRASAYLVVPATEPARADLIFGHWGEGNREEFVAEAMILARLGFVSLCLDAPFRRPAEYEPQLEEPPQADLQWIVDVRRGIDLLRERFPQAAASIGYVGHSLGATLGGTIAGIEHRIGISILMAGWYALSELMRTSTHPLIERERAATPPAEFAAYLRAMEPLDASHYIGHAAPARLVFQFARTDEFVSVNDAQRYFELASAPKEIAWYDGCGHGLNARARLDRAAVLCAQCGMPRPPQEVLDLLARVPDPVPLADWANGDDEE